jgi:hypothetical protein
MTRQSFCDNIHPVSTSSATPLAHASTLSNNLDVAVARTQPFHCQQDGMLCSLCPLLAVYAAIYLLLNLLTGDKVAETGLPPNWEAKWSSKRAYFYKYNGPNVKFDSVWESPPGTNEKKLDRYLKQRIVASHLLVKHNQSRRKSSWRQVKFYLCKAVKYT